MSVYEYIIGGILIVASLLIIFVILLQEGRQANVGVISGAADSFLDKGAARTLDQKLAKWTKVIAIAFFVLVLCGMLVTKFLSKSAISQREANKAAATASSTTTTTSTTTGSTTTTTTAAEGETTTTTTAAAE